MSEIKTKENYLEGKQQIMSFKDITQSSIAQGKRGVDFLKSTWAEIDPKDGKVTWSSVEQIKSSTWVVSICVAIFAVVLWAYDWLAGMLVVGLNDGVKAIVQLLR